jgi:uncharacterized protein YndB with AHSA1/START domain
MATSERHFDASPAEVFRALTDAERYPQWLVGARVVDVNDRRWPRPGSSFDHQVGAGPVTVADSTVVTGNEPNHRFDLVVRARPFLEADVHFVLTPHEGGTLLTMEESPRGLFKLAAPLIAPMVRVRNDRSLQHLADLIDGRPSG